MNTEPYVSVVVTARNDNHGGNLLGRMQTFLNAWFAQVKRHNLSSELLVVDWNPPEDREPLMEALQWPEDTGACEVRFIQVPAEIHRQYRYADSLPLYQMIAKNVAIRRSRGKFILATNIDIICSDELIRFFAAGNLRPGHMYRMDRYDVMADVPVCGSLDEQLEYCKTHLLRLCAREGYFELSPDGLRLLSGDDIAARDAGIYFGEGWYPLERYGPEERFRWVENDARVTVTVERDPPPLLFDLEPGPGVGRQPFVLAVLDESGCEISEVLVTGRSKLQVILPSLGKHQQSFRFHVEGGGMTLPDDPRIMNFRVFHCGWDLSKERQRGRSEADPGEAPNGAEASSTSPANDTSATGVYLCGPSPEEPPIAATLSRVQRLIRFYADSGGILTAIGSARLYRARARLFVEKVRYGQDIFESGTGISPGAGWYALENFKNETFRWVHQDAELIIRAPDDPPPYLGVQIEPGPGVGSKAFELLVKDGAGVVVSTAVVEKLRYLEIPLPVRPGRTHVFTLAATGGGLPTSDCDPRILNFRLFWCGWPRWFFRMAVEHRPRGAAADLPPLAAGLEWGAGWSELQHEEGGGAFRVADNGAELILRPADPRVKGLFLEIEPVHSSGTIELCIKDYQGRILAAHLIDKRQHLHVALPLVSQRTAVVELHVSGARDQSSAFRVYQCGWSRIAVQQDPTNEPAHENTSPTGWAIRIRGPESSENEVMVTRQPRQSVQPANPVFLHTNTCGDFTLMAREHWFELRGYPELDVFSFHIDSLLCYAAYHAGVTEEILRDPMRCYHIEHGSGSGWTPEGQNKLFGRLREAGIPWIEYSEMVTWISQMRRFNCTMIFNRENWGLADYELPEKTLLRVAPAKTTA